MSQQAKGIGWLLRDTIARFRTIFEQEPDFYRRHGLDIEGFIREARVTGRVEKWGRTFQDAVKAELGVNDEVKDLRPRPAPVDRVVAKRIITDPSEQASELASRIISAALERTVQNMEAQSRELAAEREAGERALRELREVSGPLSTSQDARDDAMFQAAVAANPTLADRVASAPDPAAEMAKVVAEMRRVRELVRGQARPPEAGPGAGGPGAG